MIPIEETKRINGNAKYEPWLTDDGLLRVEGWARDGLIDSQIAHNMGIAYSTFRDWCGKFPALSAALKKGKAPVDVEVENALYKRAIGYTATETIEEITTSGEKGPDGQYKIKERHIRKLTREVPPDVTAQIYWLNNRKPKQWRNRKATEPDMNNEAPVKVIIDV